MHEGREVSSLFLNVLVIRIYENGKYLNVSQPQNNNNDAKYTVIEMTWSENLKSCRGQVTDSLSSESHFLTLSLPKTIFIGTDTHQSLRPMIIYSTSVADVQLLLIRRLTTYQEIYISVII